MWSGWCVLPTPTRPHFLNSNDYCTSRPCQPKPMKPKLKQPPIHLLGLLLLATLSPILHADSTGEGAAKADAKPDAKSDNKSEAKALRSCRCPSPPIPQYWRQYPEVSRHRWLYRSQGGGRQTVVRQPGQKPPPEPKPETKPENEPSKTKDGLKPKAKVFFVAYTLDDPGDLGEAPADVRFQWWPRLVLGVAAHGLGGTPNRESDRRGRSAASALPTDR